MRDLAEELFQTIPVWSCDLTVAKAMQLFAAHCLRCIESVCGESPVELLTRVSLATVVWVLHTCVHICSVCSGSMWSTEWSTVRGVVTR